MTDYDAEIADFHAWKAKRGGNLRWMWAVMDSDVQAHSKLVACAIARVANYHKMEFYAGQAYLRQMTGYGRTNVRAALRELENAGWLTCLATGNNVGGVNRASVYRLEYVAQQMTGVARRP